MNTIIIISFLYKYVIYNNSYLGKRRVISVVKNLNKFPSQAQHIPIQKININYMKVEILYN